VAYWLIWAIWIPLFMSALVSLFQAHPGFPRLAISLVGAVLFFTIYGRITWQAARRLASPIVLPSPTGVALWLPIVAMVVLSLLLTGINGAAWGGLFIYTSASSAGRLRPAPAAGLVGALLLLVAVFGGLVGHMPFDALVSALVFVAIPGAIVIALVQTVSASQQLGVAREDMARLTAVTEERLRIARDLHDLLGHNLSLIALKSELAGRLLEAAPTRAAAEIADVERVARSALQEVREAVAGYRQPTLASELRNANEVFAAAGIEYRFDGDNRIIAVLPAPAEAVFAWTVREGVTNVVRHSHARHCEITIARDAEGAEIEIRDDGRGDTSATDPATTSPEGERRGNGLRGLGERVAALGGRCDARPQPEGGFRLAVWLPISSGAVEARSALPAAGRARRSSGEESGGLADEIAKIDGSDGGE
jgi:two-component system sensor histidine kinase DesK